MIPEFIHFPKIPRFSKETVIITEKIDGSNGQIYIYPDEIGKLCIAAGSRNSWLDDQKNNFGFYQFVMDNADELIEKLGPGRHFGEWYGKGINRGYGLDERRFALFNTGKWDTDNKPNCCEIVPILDISDGAFLNQKILESYFKLCKNGSVMVRGYDKPEGIIIYLTSLGKYYKVLLENDHRHKGEL